MFTLELSFYLPEIPNDAYFMLINQIRISWLDDTW